jgi:O-antigen ligase
VSLWGWFLYCGTAAFSIAASEAGLAVFLGLRLITVRRDQVAQLWRFPLFWAWVGYILTQVAALFYGGDLGDNVQRLLQDEWLSLALPVIFVNPLRLDDLRKGWAVFVGVAVLMGLYGIYQHFSGWDPLHRMTLASMGAFHRAEGMFSFYLTYGAVQMLALCLALSKSAESGVGKRVRLLYLSASGILFLSVLATYGRSLWVGLIPVGVWWFLTLTKRWKSVVAVVVITAAILISLLVPEIPQRVVSVGNETVNLTRTNLFETAWRMIEAKPILGHGIGGFSREFDQYSTEYNFETQCHPHNDSLLVWVQSGIIGLAAFWVMWVLFFRTAWLGYRRLRMASDTNRWWLIRGGVWGIVGLLIAGFFQCYYIDAEVSAVFWILAAVTARLSAEVMPGFHSATRSCIS